MLIDHIPTGKNAPDDVNVIIEVPMGADPIKYELDKDSGAVFVDRFLHTAMTYPCNYGFIPHTLAEDGDPTDVLVVGNTPLMPGCVVAARPVGVLEMEDDGGIDAKIVAVPASRLHPFYDNVKNYTDLPDILLQQIRHFFEHYKDLEPNKWVKVTGWSDVDKARSIIMDGIKAGQKDAA
ncbi:MAG: inorganic diphosphatase [Rickettsiales bacterium]|nr:inorganic diphosphatase [Rickettsiales bacterium]